MDSGIIYPEIEKSNFSVNQYVSIILEYTNDKNINQCMNDFKDLTLLISTGSGSNVPIKEMIYYHHSNVQHLVSTSLIKPMRVFISEPMVEINENATRNMLFLLTDLANENIFDNLKLKIKKIQPILNLYSTIINPNTPIELQFLNIVQALETYHSRFKYNNKEKYKQHLEELFGKKIADLKSIDKKALYGYSQSKEATTFITLKSRLSDLYLADFKFIFSALDENNDAQLYKFVDKVVVTRNYFTHYAENDEKKAMKDIET